MISLLLGDCLVKLKDIPGNSVDSIITDPPYGLVSIQKRFGKKGAAPAQYGNDGSFARLSGGFMGKKWDGTGIEYNVDMWAECLRVLKPGGHLLAFGGTRTYHRMACAIEDAGFEIRDMIEWVYGSGFPKSMNIALAIDKQKGIQGQRGVGGFNVSGKGEQNNRKAILFKGSITDNSRLPAYTNDNNEWNGWGTALKPAHEPICMARKPISEKNVAENVLKWRTGGINIGESRVKTTGKDLEKLNKEWDREWNVNYSNYAKKIGGNAGFNMDKSKKDNANLTGRFPANLIHDDSDEVKECFSGNASRFYKSIIYTPKASTEERNKGCEGLDTRPITEAKGNGLGRVCNICGTNQLKPCDCEGNTWILPDKNKNNHPTVKPVALMEYLIKMVTPSGGIVLDPFMGSGSTGVAAILNGYSFIGIEIEEEYCKIAKSRIYSINPLFKTQEVR